MRFLFAFKAFLVIFVFVPFATAGPMPVFVSILPQKYFVEKIGQDRVSVSVMVLPGASPAVYEPKPGQMARLSKARIYFAIGVPFEGPWMDRISGANKKMKVVHCDRDIRKMPMVAHFHENEKGREAHDLEHAAHGKHDVDPGEMEHLEADHGNMSHGGHNHGPAHGLDPHIWLSVPLVKIQARAILNALNEEDPENSGFYTDNFHAFIEDLDELDRELSAILAAKKGAAFMVFHPSWGYFARDYGLVQMPIEMEGKSPKPAQLVELVKRAKEHGIRAVFVQPQFSRKSAELIAKEIGGAVITADPLAENWSDNLKNTAKGFASEAR